MEAAMTDNPINIEWATPEDLVELIVIGQKYFLESKYNGRRKPDWSLYAYTLDQKIKDNLLIVARHDNKIVGFVILSVSYWLFPEGDLAEDILYVAKEYRGTAAYKGLRAAIRGIEERMNPALTWGGSTSGFDDGGRNTKMYTNSLIKEGFEPLGTACVKIHPQEGVH